MSDYGDISAVDIDNGSGTTRAGFAGDEEPICVKSTVIVRPRSYTKCEVRIMYRLRRKCYKKYKIQIFFFPR